MPTSSTQRLIYCDIGHSDLPLPTYDRSLRGVIYVTLRKLNIGIFETTFPFFDILCNVQY